MERTMSQGFSMAVVTAGQEKAKEYDVEFRIPSWLEEVPESKQVDAICRYHTGLARARDRAEEVKREREARKVTSQRVISEIKAAGYDLTYMRFLDYTVAIAYRSLAQDEKWGHKLDCHFAICSYEDRDLFSREESRLLLLQRIKSNDPRFEFHCTAPATESKRLDIYARRRFLERAEIDSTGMPHLMVKALLKAVA
jgi:hypothetical protein